MERLIHTEKLFLIAVAACAGVLVASLSLPLRAHAETAPVRGGAPEPAVSGFPTFSGFHLTQDGNRLLMLRSDGEYYDLIVKDLADGAEQIVYTASTSTGLLNWCRWANNDRIVCSARFYRRTGRVGPVISTRLFAVDHDGANLLPLIKKVRRTDRHPNIRDAQIQDQVIGWLRDDPESLLLQLSRDIPNRPGVYRLNIYTNELTRILKPRGSIRRWYADQSGAIRLGIGYTIADEPMAYLVKAHILQPLDSDLFSSEVAPVPLGFSSDGNYVYMRMTNGGDRHGVYRVDLISGTVDQTIHEDPEYDVFGAMMMDPESGEPLGVRYVTEQPIMRWFDPVMEAEFASLAARIGSSSLDLVTSDASLQRFVLRSLGKVVPAYYLHDRATGSIEFLGSQHPHLRDEQIVELQPVSYPSHDGQQIPAYLALPQERKGLLPAVILPHGGPYARDSAEFDYWTQFLVDRGYVVLKPNYRGSVGYGTAYMRSGYRQWGLKIQEDLMAGLDWLVASGIADPDRLCVVGASFGGYSALVAAFKFPEKIRCAVSFAGISDLPRMVGRLEQFDLTKRNRVRIQSGVELLENSPIHQAHRIDAPVLLVHGDSDTVVRVRQSRALAKALQRHNKEYRYVEQLAGDHFLSNRSQNDEFFDVMAEFLEEHIGAGRH